MTSSLSSLGGGRSSAAHARSAAVVVLALTLAFTGPALAQPTERATAEALFRAGRASLQAHDYATACARFHESERLESAAGTWLNLGLCEEQLGHGVSAWDYYQRVIQSLPAHDSRVDVARRHFEALDVKLPRVKLRLAPGAPDTTTIVDGTMRYRAPSFEIDLPMDEGWHVFTAEAPGFAPHAQRVELARGQRLELVLSPGPRSLPAASALAPAPAASTETSNALGWALIGVGAVALTVAAVTGVMILHDEGVVESDCHPDRSCDSQRAIDAGNEGKALSVVSPIALGVGVLSAGVGFYLLMDHDRRASGAGVRTPGASRRSGAALGVVPAPGGATLTFSRGF